MTIEPTHKVKPTAVLYKVSGVSSPKSGGRQLNDVQATFVGTWEAAQDFAKNWQNHHPNWDLVGIDS